VLHKSLERAVDAVTVDILRGLRPDVPELPGIAEALVRAARFHRIAPLAHVALRDGRPDLAALFREDRDRALEHHVRVTTTLDAVGNMLAGLLWVTFKGPVVSEWLHPAAGLRSYSDLDILVAPSDLREATGRLLASGWRVLATREDLLNGEVTGEMEVGRPGAPVVDLHWSLVLSETLRRRFDIPTADLLARSTPLMIGPVPARTLDATDTVIHLCHHAALAGAVRLVHLLDVDLAARRIQDWDELAHRARSWGAGAQVGLVLARARRVLETPLPRDLGPCLGLSRAFSTFMSAVDRAWPTPAVRREASWPRLVARAARPSTVATARTALGNAALGAVNRLRPSPLLQPRTQAGSADVQAYFAAVEAVAAVAR
jgi:hypothetical protein